MIKMTIKKKRSISYADAGVDINAGNESVKRIKKHVKSTHNKCVLSNIGNFGGLFAFDYKKYKNPVLVSSTDGVGTKLKLAYMTNKHDTVGQDLVNHCVDDILVMGAKPLFFLDYYGTSKLVPKNFEQLVKGLSIACKENNCALVGGETAELPGLYKKGEYDLASAIVGVVEKNKVITGEKIKVGDKIIALPSSGLHTNGYSLALKVLFEHAGYKLNSKVKGVGVLKNALMKVHKSYLIPVSELMKKVEIKGMAHITGGGLVENVPRILPKNVDSVFAKGSWKVPPIFDLIAKEGNVKESEMYRAFNMGIGLTIIVSKKNVGKAMNILEKSGEKPVVVGEIVKGKGKTILV